jgi:hypothetical protein
VPIKYVGFEIDKNDFVVGYGLDYAGMCVCWWFYFWSTFWKMFFS